MTILNKIRAYMMRGVSAKTITLPLSKLAGLWDGGKDIFGRRNGRPDRPYSQVDTVWTCVNLILDVASSVQLMLSTPDDEIVESGPLYDFLFRNEFMPYKKLLAETLGFYLLFREVYWVTTEEYLLHPTGLTVVGPHQMRPVVSREGVLLGYEMRSGDRTAWLDPESVFCIKNFNPDDPHRGSGPFNAGTLTISRAYQSALYNESSLANGARLSTILNLPAGSNLSEEEIERLRREFSRKQGGAANSGATFIATGGLTVDTVSQTMADLQMIEAEKYTDQKICSLFGVPPECVGLVTEAQYAQGPATQRLILYGVAPILSIFAEALDDGLIDRFRFTKQQNKTAPFARSKRYCGQRTPLLRKTAYRARRLKALQGDKKIFAWFDIDSHPAIQEMLRDRAEKLLKFTDKGIPLEQIVAAGDLPFDTSDLPWATEWWVSAGMMPARWILEGGPEAAFGPSLPEGDTSDDAGDESDAPPEKSDAAHRVAKEISACVFDALNRDAARLEYRQKANRIWQKYVAAWRPLEMEFQSAVRSYFRRQKAELLKRLDAALKTKDTADDLIARVQFDLKTENGRMTAIHKTFFERAAKLGAAQIAADVAAQSGDALKKTLDQVIRRRALKRTLLLSAQKIRGVNDTTARRIATALRSGIEAGEGLPDLRKRLEGEASFSTVRARTIARTHTGSAVSAGRHEAAVHLGAQKKFWLTSKDDAVRKSHVQAERDHADGIPVDEAFKVGGDFLLYPGDPGGSPANTVNCRCMEMVKSLRGKSFDLDYYDRAPMTDYAAIKHLLNEAQNV